MTTSPKPDWMTPSGPPWRIRSEKPIYENDWIRVREMQTVAPTGADALYGVVGFKHLAIGILPIHADGTITLVGQHRFPCRDYSWEIPEGGVPVADDPLEGAKRELREEAGLEACVWRKVLDFQTSNSVTDERGVGFVALGLTPVAAEPDPTEAIAVARVPFAEALERALSGDILDVITVAILLRAYHMAAEGQFEAPLAAAMLGRTGEGR